MRRTLRWLVLAATALATIGCDRVTKHAATITLKTGVRRDGTLTARQITIYWNGGAYADASPLLVPADGSPVREVPGGGPLIGVFGRLDLREETVALKPGDALVLYTDGVTDAARPDRERYGDARFRAVLEGHRGASAGTIVTEVVASVEAFQRPGPAADDVALVVVRRGV